MIVRRRRPPIWPLRLALRVWYQHLTEVVPVRARWIGLGQLKRRLTIRERLQEASIQTLLGLFLGWIFGSAGSLALLVRSGRPWDALGRAKWPAGVAIFILV